MGKGELGDLKETLLRVQELPRCSKSGKEGERLVWLNWDLLVKMKSNKKNAPQYSTGWGMKGLSAALLKRTWVYW